MERSLTPTEEIIMQCLWESKADLTAYEITERLRECYGREYANNAIATYMKILLKKGYVSRYKKHHSHQYHPEMDMDAYRDAQLNGFREQWYHGSAYGLLSSVVETADISEDDLKKMRELLNVYISEN